MLKGARGRRGFTLIETVVTVGIVATLAAVVVPQVVKQFDAADPTRIQNDLKNIQTAVETFTLNMSGVLPGDLDDLANPVTTDPDITTGGAPDSTIKSTGAVDAFAITAWNGPYADFALEENSTEINRSTGYGALIHDNFVCYNATDNATASNGTAADQACPSGTIAGTDRLFLAVRMTGLGTATSTSFLAVNELFDGPGETTPATQGRLRLLVVSTVPTAYFLISAIN
jgi:prepilin-type N-terminal cleavage/methylation domain-containing protein